MGALIPPIPPGSRGLLDTCTLIYFLEEHPRFGPVAERLLHRIETGDLEGRLSALAFAELLVPAYRAGEDRAAALLLDRVQGFRNLMVLDVNPAIAASAARLRAAYGLRTPDAIHAATALESQATGIVSNDAAFRRLEGALTVWLFE